MRLIRLGELKRVYHAENEERAIFKAATQHYIDLRNQQIILKQLGRKYPEIKEFKKMPGIGEILSHGTLKDHPHVLLP